jgi:hypothetical protein
MIRTKAIINPKGADFLTHKTAQEHFDRYSKEQGCYESGLDEHGNVYFAYMSGIIQRIPLRFFDREIKINKNNYKY